MFATIKDITTFAKSGAKLSQVAQAVLQNNRAEGLALLCEETLKAALAASLWNSPLKLLTVLDTVKNGKKTLLTKQWLLATTALSRELPENKAGDTSRITDETTFINETNAAIATWEKSWSAFEKAQKAKADARASATKTTATSTPTPTPTAEPADFEKSAEAAQFRDEIAELQEKLASAEMRLASVLRVAREREAALNEANEKISALESALGEANHSRGFLQQQLQASVAEIAMLRAAQSQPAKKRTKKAETSPQ